MAFRTSSDTQRSAAALLADLNRHQVPLSPGIAKAVEEADAATAGLTALARDIDTDAATALLTATLEGKAIPPATLGRAVAALLTERPNVTHTIIHERAQSVVRAIHAEATALITALRTRFDTAVADLDAAAEVLQGVTDLGDLEAVTELGGEAAGAWKKARAAETTLTGVITIVQRLGMVGVYEGVVNDPRDRALVVADLAWAGYRQVNAQTTPWTLRQLGRLDLAAPTVHAARVAGVNDEWARDPANPATRLGPGVGQTAASLMPFGGAAQ